MITITLEMRVVTVNRSGKTGKQLCVVSFPDGKYRERETKLAKNRGISREKPGNDMSF